MEVPVVIKIDDEIVEEMAEIEGKSVDEVREEITESLKRFAEFGINQLYKNLVEMAGACEEVDVDWLKDMAFSLGVRIARGEGFGETEGCSTCEESE